MVSRFRRAVVTGGAGFLGSHLCERLLRADVSVVCLDSFLTGAPRNIAHLIGEPKFRMIKCDITDFVHVPGEVDLVLHLASAVSLADYLRLPVETLKVGSLGTLHALGSVLIPPAACAHRLAGELRGAGVRRMRVPSRHRQPDVLPVSRTG